MKTLGVDQLNRFVSYLDEINRRRDPEDRITIGIWDSDTPSRGRDLYSHEIEVGSYVRGLEVPTRGRQAESPRRDERRDRRPPVPVASRDS